MSIPWSAIFWAGFVATTLAAACFWVFRTFGWTEFSPTTQLGCLFFGNPRLPLAESVGLVLLLALGSTVVAWLYAALLRQTGGVTLGGGALLGLVHGALTVAVLPVLGTISACVRSGFLPPPGRFGLAWGRGTPAGVVAGHVVYGAAVGATLAAFMAPPM
ncbi:MAG TPA: hypothetical protein VHG51_03890 [Longimicrobiaceae bacterium]|nr:hypothetical protein [Longimicrobiaceae bacterium]